MGRRGSRAVKTGPHAMLIVVFSAVLLTLMMLLAIPAKAQNTNAQYSSSKQTAQTVQGSGQRAQADAGTDDSQTATATATRAATDPASETARITESTSDPDEIVDRIVVQVADCEVASDASIVIEDNDGTSDTLTNGQNVTITPDDDTLTLVGTNGGNLGSTSASGGNQQFGTVEETVIGEVLRSTGITCGRDAGSNSGDDDNAGDGDARTAEELRDLSCEDLLALFRAGSSSSGQYGDAAALANADVQAQIEVCLEEEIVEGTAADGDLPDTGGVSLVGLAVLGLVSAAAGFSVIHGGRRRG